VAQAPQGDDGIEIPRTRAASLHGIGSRAILGEGNRKNVIQADSGVGATLKRVQDRGACQVRRQGDCRGSAGLMIERRDLIKQPQLRFAKTDDSVVVGIVTG
jgi:hypothetical protein